MSGPILYLAGRNTRGSIERELSQSGYIMEKNRLSGGSRYLFNRWLELFGMGKVVGIFIFSPRSAMILNELIRKFGLQDS